VLAPGRSASKSARRALTRVASNRRLLIAAAATVGAALAANVARALVGRDSRSDQDFFPSREYRPESQLDGDRSPSLGNRRNGQRHDSSSPSRAYRIKHGEKPAKAVPRIARGRLDNALDQLRLDHDVGTAIHETRKDLKKTRAVLRLVRDRIGEETYRRENSRFRYAAQILAGSREAEAKVETLDALDERFGDRLPKAFDVLRKRLEWERDALVAAQSDADSETRRLATRAAGEILAGRAAVDDWSYAKSGWKLLAPGLERTYKRGRARLSDARREPTPENVHEWRKRVKDLWYHLGLLRDSWPEVLGAMSDQAHELSDLLGDHHDLSVLVQDLRDRPDLAGGFHESEAIVNLLEARQEELFEAAVPIGMRLYADPPKVFVARLRAYWRAWRSNY
jgi:CHAD domain-containing protein